MSWLRFLGIFIGLIVLCHIVSTISDKTKEKLKNYYRSTNPTLSNPEKFEEFSKKVDFWYNVFWRLSASILTLYPIFPFCLNNIKTGQHVFLNIFTILFYSYLIVIHIRSTIRDYKKLKN